MFTQDSEASAKRTASEPRKQVQKRQKTTDSRPESPAPAAPSENTFTDHPFNRIGYKYTCAIPDSILKFSEFHERALLPESQGRTLLNAIDGDRLLMYNEDFSTVTTTKGWSSIRGGASVKTGTWYYEVKVVSGGGEGKVSSRTGAHCRVGWARREAYLDCPVGSDIYSYGYRDYSGDIFHQGKPKAYGEPFKSGDVIGCLIQLGNEHPSMDWPCGHPKRSRVLIKYKGNIYYESKDFQPVSYEELADEKKNKPAKAAEKRALRTKNGQTKNSRKEQESLDLEKKYHDFLGKVDLDYKRNENNVPYIVNSCIKFFKNGIFQGDAFSKLPLPVATNALLPPHKRKPKDSVFPPPPADDDGSLGYYPTVSVFKGGKVQVNFGPHFDHPPPSNLNWRPMIERIDEQQCEGYLADLIDEVELDYLMKHKTASKALDSTQSDCKLPKTTADVTVKEARNSSTPREITHVRQENTQELQRSTIEAIKQQDTEQEDDELDI